MVDQQKAILMVLIALVIYPNDIFGGAFAPEFAGPIMNLTVPLGRDAVFTCLVKHLGGYRVGWLKVETKAIQAIHDHVITHNSRVSVSHSDHTMWNLHIKNVQKEDEGLYMCQINTDPMKSQVGWLKVETKAIQAIHDHVITHNSRVSVSHSDHTMWNLHIKNVQKEDEGLYMCQINTDPMKSQLLQPRTLSATSKIVGIAAFCVQLSWPVRIGCESRNLVK
ncbi:uncharacterized protein LOC108621913 [Ceratina calcarata]|uniref:Uncharacterized protein LOC108621913 n=1 Tax=Ceratina calcarata TaxID=156304 RepID=A0AAJ7N3F9_9HYME|nr:uncharacterized protein LOC108621913 [Ceratina calcarata]